MFENLNAVSVSRWNSEREATIHDKDKKKEEGVGCMMRKKLLQLSLLLVQQALLLSFVVVSTFTGSSSSSNSTTRSSVTVNAQVIAEHEKCVPGRDGACPKVEFNKEMEDHGDGEGDNMENEDDEEDEHEDYNEEEVEVDGKEEETFEECMDDLKVEECQELALDLGCIRNFASMRDDCSRTCSLCNNVIDLTNKGFYVKNMYSKVPQKILFKGKRNEDDDDDDDGKEEEEEDFVDARQRLIKVDEYMFHTVYEQSEYKRYRLSCRNELEDCTLEAARGACEKNTQYMMQHCRPACLACQREEVHTAAVAAAAGNNNSDVDDGAGSGMGGGMSSRVGNHGGGRLANQFQQQQRQQQQEEDCPLPNNPLDGIVWQPGTSHRMFRRIVKDNSRVITIHSQPHSINPIKPIADVNEPWIVAIDDFLTQGQCDVLIELGEQTPFTSSASSSRRGRLSDDDDDDSDMTDAFKTALCLSDHCREHFVMVQVLEKIRALTGIPKENYEHMQFNKYNGTSTSQGEDNSGNNDNAKEEVIAVQHDYEPYHFTRFQGPRILTVFLYLNDVPGKHEGKVGKLEFPNLDVVSDMISMTFFFIFLMGSPKSLSKAEPNTTQPHLMMSFVVVPLFAVVPDGCSEKG